ncbi:MAG: hypothetical protein BWK79_08745 [Beggiatoa sp. IS2]|nr:MAG: hypothetical protein BWK79_08745 [Beggiatoa sp. IS2]
MNTITNNINTLPSLFRHCQMLLRLNQELSTTLPVSLQQHCYIANFRAHTLVIQVDSALWATRLRYEVPMLLKQWKTLLSFPTVDKIEIQVRPPILPIPSQSPTLCPKPALSKQTAVSLQEVANTISHPKLKEALLRLATRAACD